MIEIVQKYIYHKGVKTMLKLKKVLILIGVLLCIVTITIIMTIKGEVSLEVKSFDYSQFEHAIIRNAIEDFNVGTIKDRETAIIKAEQVWEWYFGKEMFERVKKEEQPYSVFYNPDKKMWLVQGYMKPNMIGGVAVVIIGEDGKVYAAWHGK